MKASKFTEAQKAFILKQGLAKTGRKADQEPTHSPFAIHFSAEIEGMKIYSPPRRRLKVVTPFTRRRAGSFGIVKVPGSSCRPTIRSSSSPRSMKLPRLIHSCCRNSIVS